MEVHPPHKPIHSVKEFMVHLLAITIGLLIALGLEASVRVVASPPSGARCQGEYLSRNARQPAGCGKATERAAC